LVWVVGVNLPLRQIGTLLALVWVLVGRIRFLLSVVCSGRIVGAQDSRIGVGVIALLIILLRHGRARLLARHCAHPTCGACTRILMVLSSRIEILSHPLLCGVE
jgi:hypothetical protein